jgi:hypothetical protein
VSCKPTVAQNVVGRWPKLKLASRGLEKCSRPQQDPLSAEGPVGFLAIPGNKLSTSRPEPCISRQVDADPHRLRCRRSNHASNPLTAALSRIAPNDHTRARAYRACARLGCICAIPILAASSSSSQHRGGRRARIGSPDACAADGDAGNGTRDMDRSFATVPCMMRCARDQPRPNTHSLSIFPDIMCSLLEDAAFRDHVPGVKYRGQGRSETARAADATRRRPARVAQLV